MLLYVHVPFCKSKCHYCAFHSTTSGEAERERYTELAVKELTLWGERLPQQQVSTLFFGGGTPSLLRLDQLERIINTAQKHFRFAPDFECTLEANPDSVAQLTYLNGLRSLGFNRLSLGVQSTSKEMLALLGRPHSPEQARQAVSLARQAGFSNLSVDLIWGLPGQRLSQWLKELNTVISWRPDHLSCYGLSIEPGTEFERRWDNKEIVLPTDDEQAKMFINGADLLESEGYLQYEISNYAQLGFHSRHNLGYWQGREYLGIGPSAVSTVKHLRWQHPLTLDEYQHSIESGRPESSAERLDAITQAKEAIMLHLRTAKGLPFARYKALTGRDFRHDFKPMMTALYNKGLIRLKAGHISFSRTGMLVSDTILSNIFASPVWDSPVEISR